MAYKGTKDLSNDTLIRVKTKCVVLDFGCKSAPHNLFGSYTAVKHFIYLKKNCMMWGLKRYGKDRMLGIAVINVFYIIIYYRNIF